eukprot:g36277.t1
MSSEEETNASYLTQLRPLHHSLLFLLCPAHGVVYLTAARGRPASVISVLSDGGGRVRGGAKAAVLSGGCADRLRSPLGQGLTVSVRCRKATAPLRPDDSTYPRNFGVRVQESHPGRAIVIEIRNLYCVSNVWVVGITLAFRSTTSVLSSRYVEQQYFWYQFQFFLLRFRLIPTVLLSCYADFGHCAGAGWVFRFILRSFKRQRFVKILPFKPTTFALNTPAKRRKEDES